MLSRRDFLKIAGLGAGATLLKMNVPVLVSGAPTPTPTPTPPPVPTPASGEKYQGRKLCFVLWDHELAKYNYQPRNLKNPVPETCPLYSGAINPVTPAWEAYWKGILRLCNPNMKEVDFQQSWDSLVASNRAFTNGTGPSTGHFALHSLTCAGATHEMVTGVPDGGHIQIYTLDSLKEPPPIPTDVDKIDMTRHFFATTGSNLQFPDGSYAVYGFPQFENCIVPLVSPSGADAIDISRIIPVSDLQNPYHTWRSQGPLVGGKRT